MEPERTQTHTAGLLRHMLRHLCGVAGSNLMERILGIQELNVGNL